MPRFARIVVPGLPHHVTQRGNRGADIFADDDDRRKYLQLLAKYSRLRGLDLLAYCLMTNHVHLIVVPRLRYSMAQALRDAHALYALSFNERVGATGHLWQGRFYSTVLDEERLWAAVRYVERNPVRAGLADRASEYRWSSAPAHCGLRTDPLLWSGFPEPGIVNDWASWLGDQPKEEADFLRKQTHSGRPSGPTAFCERLAEMLGRPTAAQKRGRHRRQKDQSAARSENK